MPRAFTLIELLFVLTLIALVAALSIPGLIEARKSANEGSAVAALKTIGTQEALFKEGDSEKDENLDYGNLRELSDAQLIDAILGSGSKAGYRFQCEPSFTTRDTLWFAVANPALGRRTGDRYFLTNQTGAIYYTGAVSFDINNTDCEVPTHATPIR